MFLGKVHGIIYTHKRKGYLSHNFLLRKSYRDGGGRPTNKILFNFGSYKDSKISDSAERFWRKVDSVLDYMVQHNQIYRNDAQRAREVFGRVMPRPAPIIPKTPLSPEESVRK